jgi:lysophospholipase L1-like esterase
MGIIIDDLNSVVAPNIDEYVRKDDNIHLSEKGIDACAKHVAEFIKSIEI